MRAINSLGEGPFSSLNTDGILAQTVPHQPPTAPSRNSGTSVSTLIIDYPTLTGEYTGGSTILSLHLQWDKGTGGETWTTLIGDNPYSTSVTYTYSSGLIESGRIYKFRYRAKNVFGWGEFSEQGDILAAAEPGQMDQVTVTSVGTDVKIAWTPPEENGSAITAYKIVIQTQEPLVYEESLTYCDGTSEKHIS